VKHNKSRHEKDDRRSVDNRKDWVLGFDNREKLAIFEEQYKTLRDKIAKLDEGIEKLKQRQKSRGKRVIQCQTLVNLQWQEIDAVPLLERIAAIEAQLKQAREGNSLLRQLGERIGRQQEAVDRAGNDLAGSMGAQKNIREKIGESEERLALLREDPTIVPLTPYQKQGLDERYARVAELVRLDKLDALDRQVSKVLNAEVEEIHDRIRVCEKVIEESFASFIRQWRAEADGLDAPLAAAPDFFAKRPAYRIGNQNSIKILPGSLDSG